MVNKIRLNEGARIFFERNKSFNAIVNDLFEGFIFGLDQIGKIFDYVKKLRFFKIVSEEKDKSNQMREME